MNKNIFVDKKSSIILSKLKFDEPTFAFYEDEQVIVEKYFRNPDNLNSKFERFNKLEHRKYSAPTVNQALDWIFSNYKYFVKFIIEEGLSFEVIDLSKGESIIRSEVIFQDIIEAKKESLEFILNYLEEKSENLVLKEIKNFLRENSFSTFEKSDEVISEFLIVVN